MKITVESDDLTLEHVKGLAKWLRSQFKGTESHVDIWIEAPDVQATEAIAMLGEVIGRDLQSSKIIRLDGSEGGNGK